MWLCQQDLAPVCFLVCYATLLLGSLTSLRSVLVNSDTGGLTEHTDLMKQHTLGVQGQRTYFVTL